MYAMYDIIVHINHAMLATHVTRFMLHAGFLQPFHHGQTNTTL